MPLDDKLGPYKAKRDFSVTQEPAEGGKASKSALSFVVQKHWATRLHFDFRLELGGTLKSWAIPKGPSYDPHDKRLAVHVEDHPISYASFEGTIPPKQYGAGKVIIWDEGTWHPIGDAEQAYRDGNLKFELRGHKLAGQWALIRMKGKGEKKDPWLLIKEKDRFAKPASAFSVVDEWPDSVKGFLKPKAAGSARKGASSPTKPRSMASEIPNGALKAELPATLTPQLATLVDAPPTDAQDWVYEIKYDGYRLLARIEGKRIRLLTRNGNDWTAKLGALHAELKQLGLPDGWYDGEIVVVNAHGVTDFGALQNAFDSSKTQNISFFVFDVPYCNGYDLRNVPLEARRMHLQALLAKAKSSGTVRFSEAFDAAPEDIVASACQLGLEGVLGKRRDSVYRSSRSRDWIKLKCGQRQEFVIGGWTDPKGRRSGLGSLLLGVYDGDGELIYAGNVGTGFSEKVLKDLRQKLGNVATNANPFRHGTGIEGKPHWVAPQLVAEVSFSQWTSANHIRHSSFHGLRTDKDPGAIVREQPQSPPRSAKAVGKSGKRHDVPPQALLNKLRVTHPDRVIDESTGIQKIELVRYYALVGALMMPHLQNRPVALVRAPGGVGGPLFFQKHAETEKLPGIAQMDPTLYAGHPPLLTVAREEGLLSAAQWNMVEVHTMNAVADSFDHPNRIVFDLDPGEGVAWPTLLHAAEALHIFLTQLGLPAFLKTSGGKGLHVVVPIKPVHGWAETKDFAAAVVRHLSATLPKLFVAKSGPKNRIGRIYIDYLRNGVGATTVSAWSARARPGLGISVPLEWSELATLRAANQWDIRTVQSRLDTGNSPWKAYARSAKALTKAMKAIESAAS